MQMYCFLPCTAPFPPLQDQHAAGEGGVGSGAGRLLQRPVGKHPDQPGRPSARGLLRPAAPQPQALHGGPALHHGQ